MSSQAAYAVVAVNAAIDNVFDYAIPDALRGRITIGQLVRVGFRTSQEAAIVVDLKTTTDIRETKPILERLDPRPVVTGEQIALSRWLSVTYGTPLGLCLWLWLPPGLTGKRQMIVDLITPEVDPQSLRDDVEVALVALLRKRGALSDKQLSVALPGKPWRAAVEALTKARIIRVETTLGSARVRPKVIKTAAIAIHPADITDRVAALNVRKHDLYLRILSVLARDGEPVALSWLYAQTDCKLADLRRLADADLIVLDSDEVMRDSLAGRDFVAAAPPTLSNEQAAVWETIRTALLDRDPHTGAHSPFLLHGVTGSGKTEIYLKAIELTLALGRSAILLLPEIALTPQMLRRVAARFPGRTGVVHSGLNEGERFDTWRRARENKLHVIVGARSALFTPLRDVGLVVLDEEHDPSYKQSPPLSPPHYHARAVAAEWMRVQRGVVLLGSATPDVETSFRADRGEVIRLQLPRRIMGHREAIARQAERSGSASRYRDLTDAPQAVMIDLPPVTIVDMRAELKAGNTTMFSRVLQNALHEILARREQAILFLNRRGQATYVFCRDCGYIALCPRCDTPLTYHREGEALRCHRCSHSAKPPTTCPTCRSTRIRHFGAGTQQVEAAAAQLLPNARIVRWDADTANSHAAHEAILTRFIERKADILVGTQMVAKGHDLPLVTLVGVVSADTALALPDFRASERTFQLLTQVAGRAGRGVLGGRVILQTYQPAHYAITAAAGHDYAAFYQEEIARRRDLGYPPFRHFVRLLFATENAARAQQHAETTADRLRAQLAARGMNATEIIGPAPCFFTRENRVYRWHLLIRGASPADVLVGIDLPSGTFVDRDPLDIL